MATIDQRLQILERELQRSRRLNRMLVPTVIAIACIAGAEFNLAEPPAQQSSSPLDQTRSDVGRPAGVDRLRTIEADEFVLLDRLGRTRARMIAADEGPSISMFDEAGEKRLEISQSGAASGLRLFAENGEPVISLLLSGDPDPAALEIKGPQGISSLRSDGISVRDSADHQRLHLALINGNFPVLGIRAAGQAGGLSTEMTSGNLKLHDGEGHPTLSVSAAERGGATLTMHHPQDERSLQISTGQKNGDGPEIQFFAPAESGGSGGLLPYLQLGLHEDHQPYIRMVDSDGRPRFTAPTE